MNRTVTRALAILLFLGMTHAASAQVKVVRKDAPAYGPDEEVVYETWISTWGLRTDSPEAFPLGPVNHTSEAEAVEAANAHIAKTVADGDSAVTHYLIQGEPSVRTKKGAVRAEPTKDLLSRLQEAKEELDQTRLLPKGKDAERKEKQRQLNAVVKEYKDRLQKMYLLTLNAKRSGSSSKAAAAESVVRDANSFIDQYNRQVHEFHSVMGKTADLGFSPLVRIPVASANNDAGATKGSSEVVRKFLGTDWGGWIAHRVPKGGLKRNPDADFLISFDEDGRCYVLVGEPEKQTVINSESTWRPQGDAIVVAKLGFLENVTIRIDKDNSDEALGTAVSEGGEKHSVGLHQDWGLKAFPPTAGHKDRWMIVAPGDRPDHHTARPVQNVRASKTSRN